jgi:LemA protein
MSFLVAIVVVIALIAIVAVSLYNKFVRLRNRSQNAWAQVDVQLKRRYDLIPNLVESVKGYATHEREVFERVTEARSMGIAAQSVPDQARAENMLTSALKQLFAVAENYPQLRATENFQELQQELSKTESQIAVARQIYNDTVMLYNNGIQTFPGVLVAGMFGFRPREFFEVEEASREAVHVDFSDMPGREQQPPAPQPPAQN